MEGILGWFDSDVVPREESGPNMQAKPAHDRPQDSQFVFPPLASHWAEQTQERHSAKVEELNKKIPADLKEKSKLVEDDYGSSWYHPSLVFTKSWVTTDDMEQCDEKSSNLEAVVEDRQTQLTTYIYPGSDGSPGCNFNTLAVNSTRSSSFESDFCKGEVLFLHREENNCKGVSPYADHFADKQRQFEVRFQCVLKKAPRELFIVGEVRKGLGLSSILIVFLKALIAVGSAIAAARGAPVAYNFDSCDETADDNFVRPHWSVPIYAANFVHRTLAGDTPPLITQPFEEIPRQAKLDAVQSLNVGDTLTVAFWDMYMNFENREMCNMPLGLNTSWQQIVGDQDLQIGFYDWVGPNSGLSGLHTQANKDYLVSIVPCQVGNVKVAEEHHNDAHALRRPPSSRFVARSRCWQDAFVGMFKTCSLQGDLWKKVACRLGLLSVDDS